MSTKISIFKTTADGEQVNVEIELTQEHLKQMQPSSRSLPDKTVQLVPGKSLREIFEPCFRLVDERLFEMNSRIMASNVLVKKLSPEAQYAVHNVMEVLHGKSQGPAPAEILEEARREHQAAQRLVEEQQKQTLQATAQVKTDVPE